MQATSVLRFKGQFVCCLMMQKWMSRTYPLIHRVKGVVKPTTHSHIYTQSEVTSLHTERPTGSNQHASESDKCFKESMLAWSSSSDFPGPGEARWSFLSAADWGCQTCRTTESNPTHTGGLKVWKFYDSHYSEGNVSTQEWKHKESEKFFAHEGFVAL